MDDLQPHSPTDLPAPALWITAPEELLTRPKVRDEFFGSARERPRERLIAELGQRAAQRPAMRRLHASLRAAAHRASIARPGGSVDVY